MDIGIRKHHSISSVSGCPLWIYACIHLQLRGGTEQLRISLMRYSTLVRGLPVLSGKGKNSICLSCFMLLCGHLRSYLVKILFFFFFLKGKQGSFFYYNKQRVAEHSSFWMEHTYPAQFRSLHGELRQKPRNVPLFPGWCYSPC